jgi:hypothetical protein
MGRSAGCSRRCDRAGVYVSQRRPRRHPLLPQSETGVLKRAVEAGKVLGRPRISEKVERRIQEQLRAGKGILKVAHEVGVGHGTVQPIADAMRPFDAAAA